MASGFTPTLFLSPEFPSVGFCDNRSFFVT
jgi:hypothetical protein